MMDLNAILDSQWFAVALTLIGIILASSMAVNWATNNGRAVGRFIGRKLPGDQVEKWLVVFLEGMKQGLEETYTEVTITSRTQQPTEAMKAAGVKTLFSAEVRANPLSTGNR